MMGEAMMLCTGCGKVGLPAAENEGKVSTACSNCPPRDCDNCGGVDHMDAPCACWTDMRGMSLADLKAVFAHINLSVETPRPAVCTDSP